MKRIASICLALILIFAFASCGKKSERILYNDVKLSKIADLGDYKGITVDTSSDTFKEFYDDTIAADVENNGFYVLKKEGKVAKGDTVNIDYEGKKDGVAFDGGTAAGYDLVIGSGTFIDGFEDGLVGVAIGDTVDLKLKFPESYDNESFAVRLLFSRSR